MDVVVGKRLSFGQLHFGSARLGDARRTRRLVKIADRIMGHPGGSLPQKMSGWAELMALYRLVEADPVTHDAVLQTHCRRTQELAGQAGGGVILRLHDTTELDYTHVPALHDQLGPVGDGHGRGYLCHNVLAVTPGRRVLGLCAQLLHKRREVPAGETGPQKRAHPRRESLLWLKGLDAAGGPPSTGRWVDVADRGADTFEFLAHLHRRGCRYVIRCARERALAGDDHVAVDRIHAHLLAYTRDLPTLGTRTVEVKRQQKTRRKPPRKAREATVRIAAGPVTLAPPHWACGDYAPAEPLALWVTHVLELNPPAGETALEWILLSNVPTESFAAACERVDWYGCRPMVEELHKGMKTGCGIELMQFEHADRLEPLIAVLSVVAAVLLQLRQAARRADAGTTPATTLLPALFVQVLSGWRYADPRRPTSVLEFTMALARLGGHLNRKGDGFPGWLTLWRGWEALRMMVMGAQAIGGVKCV